MTGSKLVGIVSYVDVLRGMQYCLEKKEPSCGDDPGSKLEDGAPAWH
jgi:hypothetical protein